MVQVSTQLVVGTYICTHQGGFLFLDAFPVCRKDPDGTGLNHWLYIPSRLAGIVNIEADSRIRLVDQNGTSMSFRPISALVRSR
jgi:hypothetical protein